MADVSARKRPMVEGIARHLGDPSRAGGVAAAVDMVLVDKGLGSPSLHHPYMEEVISETKEHHIDGNVEI
ncbi:MAG: hypothetical protein EBV66_02305, partial [Actinobacteria bacterium]|nr:hypothetical protein [Actinomycetota bacterium]